jgi:predicted metal-dependent phosphoesterase TrpH
MMARGYVASVHEAFVRFLTKGAPAYVNRYRLSPADGIRFIRAAGGVAVMAHPFTWQPDDALLEPALRELQALGLGGIEAYYPEYMPERTVTYLRLARKLGLVATGGTDYHGVVKPDLRLGSARGNFAVPDDVLAPLLAALPSHDWVTGAQ